MHPRSSIPARRKRILLVDDDIAAGNAIAQALGDRYDVTMARDGLEGVAMAAQVAPDLIISDVTMPNLDGVSMVRRIREEHGSKAPVIFLTALDSPTAVIAGIGAGARHYLTKPVDLNDLEKRIGRVLHA
ncbi:MAG TPA: response regulator transcription factor [Polyangiaceae bacterium]